VLEALWLFEFAAYMVMRTGKTFESAWQDGEEWIDEFGDWMTECPRVSVDEELASWKL